MKAAMCRLCLQEKPLVNSHLMARGLYDYCRPPDGDPIFFSGEVVMESGRQLQHPLLCEECDGSLSRNGEDWLLPLLATIGGTFPFFDILQKGRPDVADGDSKLYAASRNPEVDTSKVTHFAMGVFWKASVHSWKRGETAPVIELGEYAGGAYIPAFFAGMYAPLRCARAKKRHLCWSPDPIQRGAYITTKGVVTYAPPATIGISVYSAFGHKPSCEKGSFSSRLSKRSTCAFRFRLSKMRASA